MKKLIRKGNKPINTDIFNRRKFVYVGSLFAFVSAFLPKISWGAIVGKIKACETTTVDIEGPFYLSGAPNKTILADVNEPGERLFITGRVFSSDCITPVENAVVDVWHSDDSGNYDNSSSYNLRGIMNTDANGNYGFETILPGQYDIGGGQFRPSHIHFKALAQAHTGLTTQLYFEGDPFIAADPWASDPAAANRIIPLTQDINSAWHGVFDIVLDSSVGVKSIETKIETGYLLQNHPNPFSASTLIRFGVFEKSKVELYIFDLSGRLVKKLLHQTLPNGRYTAEWNRTDQAETKISSGAYICRLMMNGKNVKNIRMIVQK